MADIEALKHDFGDNKYFKSGEDAADLLTMAIGPVEKPK